MFEIQSQFDLLKFSITHQITSLPWLCSMGRPEMFAVCAPLRDVEMIN